MIFTLNFHEFLLTVYKCVLNSVVTTSMIFAKYFEYYTVILGGRFLRGHAADVTVHHISIIFRSYTKYLIQTTTDAINT